MPKQKKVEEPIDTNLNTEQRAGAIMLAQMDVTALKNCSDPKRLEAAIKHLDRLLKAEQESRKSDA